MRLCRSNLTNKKRIVSNKTFKTMSRTSFALYLITMTLSVIFMLGFFKETFLLNSHSYGTVDPLPDETYGTGPEDSSFTSRGSKKAGARRPSLQFRRLLHGEGRFISKKSPFMKDYFFKFLDLSKKGSSTNPIDYGVELFKFMLRLEYERDGDFNWSSSIKYDPKKSTFPRVRTGEVAHPLSPGRTIGEILPHEDVRQIHIATSWRSGSTFLGDLLNEIMGTYYSFEPLHVESLTMPTSRRLELMKGIFQCDFENKEVIGWIRHATKRENNFLFGHNFRAHKICQQLLPGKVACFMDKFQGPLCSMSPVRVIKTVRLRVADAEFFLSDPKSFPNYKMIVLVRDPRGTMHSRSHRTWCSGIECINSTVVCRDLEKDAESAYALAEKYPGRVYLIRYEDICIQPYEEVEALFAFLGISSQSKGLKAFIQRHMFWKSSEKNPYSTYRNSNAMYMKWRKTVDMSYIHKIQEDCDAPMKTLGYRPFFSKEDRDNHTISVLSKSRDLIWPKSQS